MKVSALYRIAAVLLLLLTPDTHLVFPGPIPSGEWIFVPCVQLTLPCGDDSSMRWLTNRLCGSRLASTPSSRA